MHSLNSDGATTDSARALEDENHRLRRRVADLEQLLLEWVDRFESSPIPMTVEDWSGARRIVDDLRAAGVKSILEHVRAHPELLAELAPAAKILDANPACVQVYRASSREQLLDAFNQPPDLSTYNPTTGLSDIFVTLVQRFANGETRVELEGPDTALDGSRIYIRTTTSIAAGREHDWGSVLQTVEDFTRREEAEREVRRLAATDALTGLANRHRYETRLSDALNAARRSGDVVGLLQLDLDGFKQVNDRAGHLLGDEILRVVGVRLQAVSREADCVARVGGDEFAVVLSGPEGEDLLEKPAARIIESLCRPFELAGESLTLGVSIGGARFPIDAIDIEQLKARADKSMYRAKRSGGGVLCMWDPTRA